ncbi:MAG: hypothetical protein ACXVJD_00560 [Mucilaginibacter sp.]
MKFTKCIFLTALLFAPFIGFCQDDAPVKEALKLFNHNKRAIERKNDGVVQEPEVFISDLNNDDLPDCILSFVITPKGGGNLILGHESYVYINTGKRMKFLTAFPRFKFCYGIDHVKNNLIYLKQYECAPPYNVFLKESKLAYRRGKIIEVQ